MAMRVGVELREKGAKQERRTVRSAQADYDTKEILSAAEPRRRPSSARLSRSPVELALFPALAHVAVFVSV